MRVAFIGEADIFWGIIVSCFMSGNLVVLAVSIFVVKQNGDTVGLKHH